MIGKPTTDNFLPPGRGGSHYRLRPIAYTSRPLRSRPVQANHPPISDFLPVKVHSAPIAAQTPPAAVLYVPPAPEAAIVQQPIAEALAPAIQVSRQRKPSKKQLVSVLATIIIILLAAASLVRGKPMVDQYAPVKAPQHVVAQDNHDQVKAVTQVKPAVGWPIRLKIPKIGVDTALDYVGITSRGALDAPRSPTAAGWYSRGPRPGEVGSAVIDGHFGWKDNIPAVFDNLHSLRAGDSIVVEDDRQATVRFVVREVQTYEEHQASTAVFVANDKAIHLNLITCDGAWSKTQKSYANRLVVFADKE